MTGGVSAKTEVEPLSNYLVGRANGRHGRRGAIGVLATAVNRDLSAPSFTTIFLRRPTSPASTGTISSTANVTG